MTTKVRALLTPFVIQAAFGLALFTVAQAATVNTGALSQNGWYSDDTRADGTGTQTAGTNLISDTLTDDPEGTASGTSVHDADILAQIPFVAAPGTVPLGTNTGSVRLTIAAGAGAGKSQISHRKDDGTGHAAGSVFGPGLSAEYSWMGDGTGTVTASLKFGIKTADFGSTGVSSRTGENVWDKVLIYEPGGGNGQTSDSLWHTETISHTSGKWWFFDRTEIASTIATPMTLADMAGALGAATPVGGGGKNAQDVYNLIVAAGAHITSVQFGIGSGNAGGNVYVNQLETNFYRSGDVTTFGPTPSVHNITQATDHFTIQDGIDNALSGDVINVDAGTFSENVTLNKTLTLNGANAGATGCGRVTGAPSPVTETVLTAPSGIILELLNGCTGSTIDGFAFDGDSTASNGIRSNGGPLTDLTIQNNWIGRTLSSGIFLNDSGTDVTVHQNELDGSYAGGGGYTHLDQDAFDGFHFTDNCVLNAANGTGLFVDGNHNIGLSTRAPLISGNVVDGNETGMNLGRFAFEYGTISGNTFDSNLYDGLQGGIQNTTISGNLFDSNGRHGLRLTGFGGTGDATRGAQNCTITGNTFTGNVLNGLFYEATQFPGTISTNLANNNDFLGNVTGAFYAGTEALDVSCNWWGDLGGPDAPSSPNAAGDDISGTTFVFWPWLDGSIVGSPNCDQYGGNTVAAAPDGDCLSITNTCETVPVNFNRTDTSGARGVSATIQLSSELMLCSGLPSIAQGTWLSGFPGQTVFQVVDNGGGSYTVDQTILGETPLPCGETSGGQLFTIDVKASGGDGTGTITVTEVIVRDCANAPLPGIPGPPASITIDTGAPTAVADLSALQVKTGNTAGQDTTGISVSFTEPGDAAAREIYGAAYGNYPEYDDAPGAGAVPAIPSYPPGGPWVLASTAASPATVVFDDRDFYYFVVFTKDACGNVSAVSNMTSGTLNYHLGDVTDGATNGHGNNSVGTEDISHLGFNYGITLAASDPLGYLDVGPTADFSVDALPQTDNEVEFEDLMMFAINFGQVSRVPGTPTEAPIENPQIVLISDVSPSAGNVLNARLVLQDNGRSVKGVHTQVDYDRSRLELVSVQQGGLLDEQAAAVFFKDLPSENGVIVDAAVLGRELTLSGSGEVATLTFRVLSSGAVPVLADAALRGRDNLVAGRQPVVVETPQDNTPLAAVGLPERLELLGARPNPFRSSTDIVFRIPAASNVSVDVYDVSGRLVRSLVDRTLPAGEHHAAWDGRASDGQPVSSGIYFYTFRTDGHQETRRLIHFR